MNKLLAVGALALAALFVPLAASAHTDVSIGVNLGVPLFGYYEPVYERPVVYPVYDRYYPTNYGHRHHHDRWCEHGRGEGHGRGRGRGHGSDWDRHDDNRRGDDDGYRGEWRGGRRGHR